jgi:Rrf2 family protein
MYSRKCQYALRAVFELASRYDGPPVKAAEIARSQAVPLRFLEVILNRLKQGKFVKSTRGREGGYRLARSPGDLTVGEVIRHIEGQLAPVECVLDTDESNDCPFYGSCVFLPMWEEVDKALADVYDKTTFFDLLERRRQAVSEKAGSKGPRKKGATKNVRKRP